MVMAGRATISPDWEAVLLQFIADFLERQILVEVHAANVPLVRVPLVVADLSCSCLAWSHDVGPGWTPAET